MPGKLVSYDINKQMIMPIEPPAILKFFPPKKIPIDFGSLDISQT